MFFAREYAMSALSCPKFGRERTARLFKINYAPIACPRTTGGYPPLQAAAAQATAAAAAARGAKMAKLRKRVKGSKLNIKFREEFLLFR